MMASTISSGMVQCKHSCAVVMRGDRDSLSIQNIVPAVRFDLLKKARGKYRLWLGKFRYTDDLIFVKGNKIKLKVPGIRRR
jgi:hypothetical protein